VRRAHQDEEERRHEGDGTREQRAEETARGVTTTRRSVRPVPGELTQRHRVQELRTGHPVVGTHDVVLHQGHDDEPATVGERADLKRDPRERPETTRSPEVRDRERRQAGS